VKEIAVKAGGVLAGTLGLRNFLVNDQGQLLENGVFRQLIDKYGLESVKFWRTADKKKWTLFWKESGWLMR